MEKLNKAIVFDRRGHTPPIVEDEKDRRIKELETNIRALENKIAHLMWAVSAHSFL